MKKLLLSLCVLAAFVGTSISWEGHVRGHIDKMEELTQEILDAMERERWEAATELLAEFGDRWEHLKRHWKLMINHDTLDRVEELYRRGDTFSKLGEKNLSYGEMRVLLETLRSIPELYEFSLSNVF